MFSHELNIGQSDVERHEPPTKLFAASKRLRTLGKDASTQGELLSPSSPMKALDMHEPQVLTVAEQGKR